MKLKCILWVICIGCHVSTTSSLIVSGNQILKAIGQLRDQISEVALNVNSMEAKFRSLESKIEEKDATKTTSQEERLDTIENVLLNLEGKMGHIENLKRYISDIDDKIGRVETKMANIEGNVERIEINNEADTKSVESSLLDINTKLGTMESKLESIESKAAIISTRTSNVEEKLGQMEPNIGKLSMQIENLDGKIGIWDTNVRYIITKVENVDTEIKSIALKLGSMESHVLSLKPNNTYERSNLEEILESANIKMEGIGHKVAEIYTKASYTEEKIRNLEPALASWKEELQNNISYFKPKMESLQVYIGDIFDSSIEKIASNTKTEIDRIETTLYTFTATNCSEKEFQETTTELEEQINVSHTSSTSEPVFGPPLPKSMNLDLDVKSAFSISCHEIRYELNTYESGVYKIFPFCNETFIGRSKNVYCDMESYGGGWTVFQQRGIPSNLTETDRSELFNKTWDEYKNGFGDPNNDYWLGLDTIYQLTKDCNHEMVVTVTHLNGTLYQAHYSTFSVSSEEDKFKLKVDNYIRENSTMADTLVWISGNSFSTIDRDNTPNNRACSENFNANGFWFTQHCIVVNLNGMYPSSDHPETASVFTDWGIVWHNINSKLKLKRTEMKIRPNC